MKQSTFKLGLAFLVLLTCLFVLGGGVLTTLGTIVVVTGLLAFFTTLTSLGRWSQEATLDLAYRRLFTGPIGLFGCMIDIKEWRFTRQQG
jgi:hypothetical protein